MPKDPAFLFYPNDYIGGTMGMTFEEKGAYMELLMMQFNRGHMTSHMIGQTVGQSWDNIKDKFQVDDKGLYFNERLEHEQSKRKEFTKSRRNNIEGINQYSKNENHSGHMEGHKTSHMENVNEDVNNTEIEFSKFWDLYDFKVGSKIKCFAKWKRLNKSDRKKIFETLPNFINGIKDKQFQPHPQTYLSNERWNDELPKRPMSTKEQLIAAKLIRDENK